MTTPPTVTNNPSRHRFEIDLGGGEFAFAAYNLVPGAIRFPIPRFPEVVAARGSAPR